MGWQSTYPFFSDKLQFNTFENSGPYASVVGKFSTNLTYAGLAGNTIAYEFVWEDKFPSLITGMFVFAFTPDPIPFRIPVLGPVFAYASFLADASGAIINGPQINDNSSMQFTTVPVTKPYIGGHQISDAGGVNPTPGRSDDDGTLLQVSSIPIGIGASIRWILPVSMGKHSMRIGGAACNAILQWSPPLANGFNSVQFVKAAGAADLYVPDIIFPADQGTLTITNTSGVVSNYWATIHTSDMT